MPDDLRHLIREIPNFPEPGITFRDITPLLGDPDAFQRTIDWFAARYADQRVDKIVGIESRGFIFGAPLADRLGVGFVPVRKPGKLPAERHAEEYVLEYGSNILEIHKDALLPGEQVVIVDDLLATGGTALATTKLVELTGASVLGLAFLVELTELDGGVHLQGYRRDTMIHY